MNNKFNAVVLLAALAPAAAMAQTSFGSDNVIFYGKLDVAYDSVHFSAAPTHGSTSASYLSNDISYWGVRGSEDLGGGTRAYFKLESGFSPDTGANTGGTSQFFDREAYVGYGSDWGSLQLGSQFAPSLFVQARSDPFGRVNNGNGVALTQQIPGNLRGFLGANPQNNAVQYLSPNIGGFSAKLLYGLSERAAAPTDLGRFTGGSFEYAKGALYAGLSYEDQILAGATSLSTLSNRTLGAGASYDFGSVKLFGYLMRNRLSNASDVSANLVGLNIPLGLATIKASYAQREIDNTAGGRTDIYAIGYFYHLSKRTEVYTSYAHLNNGAATNFGIWPSDKTYAPPVVAGGAGLPVPGQDVTSLEVGFRHFF